MGSADCDLKKTSRTTPQGTLKPRRRKTKTKTKFFSLFIVFVFRGRVDEGKLTAMAANANHVRMNINGLEKRDVKAATVELPSSLF
jgi:hypothetical protein